MMLVRPCWKPEIQLTSGYDACKICVGMSVTPNFFATSYVYILCVCGSIIPSFLQMPTWVFMVKDVLN